MAQKKPNRAKERDKRRLSWKKMAEEATVDCYNEYEQIGGWEVYLESAVTFPCRCKVGKKEGTLVGFDTTKYGSALLAIVEVDGNRYKVDATTVTILEDEFSKYLEAFKKWV